MALDVYVGSLTRYFGDSDRRALAIARTPEHLRTAVIAWRAALSEQLGSRIATPLDWDETPDAPHFTGRLGWDGFGSLVLWAAYAEHPALRRPESLPEAWDDDPALARSKAAGFRSRYTHLLRDVELWLPSPFEFDVDGEDVAGRRVTMGSAATLQRQLADLNLATWKASAAAIARWQRRPPDAAADLEFCARYGFAVLIGLVRQAVDHRLPMKLDY
ncbi:MAG: hypothetical protein K2Y40_06720 [Reyranella sp.]|nr:hypothetical protein [Reyranella sp.]